jgi:HK97 gp10 family phage protein
MPVSIEVQSLRELQRIITQRVQQAKGTDMERAMQQAVMLVMRDAKVLAPVDTGRLRASIVPDVQVVEGDIVQGVVGSNVEYAPFVEYGTRKMGGRPYIGKAFALNRDRIKRLLGEVVERMTHMGDF